MQAPLLWALGFAMGIAAWVALGWLLLTGARTTVASASAGYRELRTRHTEAEVERAVAELDAARREREERIARRAASRARRLAA
jgi:aryl-alcohol dehydrogenase-like predicted oxidoreductase